MLGVEDHLAAVGHQVGDALADHRQVLVGAGAEDLGHLEERALADDGDRLGAGVQQGPQALVVRGLHALAAGHAEGADPDVLQRQFADALEVLRVLLIRGRVAALDIVDAQAVQPLGDGQLVLQREADAFGLRAVAEGRVVDLDAGHG